MAPVQHKSTILSAEQLEKLRIGSPVNVLYANTPTTMIYYGKTTGIDPKIQLVELPKYQEKYFLFSAHTVPFSLLFHHNNNATIYLSEVGLPRRILPGDLDYNNLVRIMDDYDHMEGRIPPPRVQEPVPSVGLKSTVKRAYTSKFTAIDELLNKSG